MGGWFFVAVFFMALTGALWSLNDRKRKTIRGLAEIIARLHKENEEVDKQNMIRKGTDPYDGKDPDRNKNIGSTELAGSITEMPGNVKD